MHIHVPCTCVYSGTSSIFCQQITYWYINDIFILYAKFWSWKTHHLNHLVRAIFADSAIFCANHLVLPVVCDSERFLVVYECRDSDQS